MQDDDEAAPLAVAEAAEPAEAQPPRKKKPKKRKEKEEGASRNSTGSSTGINPSKKPKKRRTQNNAGLPGGASMAQMAVHDAMRKALDEDQYSAGGSIVDTEDSDPEDYVFRNQTVRLDRAALLQAVRNLGNTSIAASQQQQQSQHPRPRNKLNKPDDDDDEEEEAHHEEEEEEEELDEEDEEDDAKTRRMTNKKKRKTTGEKESSSIGTRSGNTNEAQQQEDEVDPDRDGGSIFGQTTGSSNATWVECDKCKKWRRLRGVVDESKLPSRWYCSMNKGDPDRSRCSAPEEAYEAPPTPESAADARTRKHLRVWVRRLQCTEAYESRQTVTRGKRKAAASSSKEPYEWVRCCSPACGKWRAVLKMMDAKSQVMDRTVDRAWFCVMNTWDEKMASCAAPQENLPALGCPPWVLQDETS